LLEPGYDNEKLKEITHLIKENKMSAFSEDSQDTLWLHNPICVPNLKHIRELILKEAHDSVWVIWCPSAWSCVMVVCVTAVWDALVFLKPKV
jgi:dephospho-CoA kinase